MTDDHLVTGSSIHIHAPGEPCTRCIVPPPADDRLDRMLRDPEAYWAEVEERAREMVEADVRREMLRAAERRRQARRAFWSRWLRWLR